MNPTLNFRGPNSIDTAALDTNEMATAQAVAHQNLAGNTTSLSVSAPAVQRKIADTDHDGPEIDGQKKGEQVGNKIKGINDPKLAVPPVKNDIKIPEKEKEKTPEKEATPCKTSKLAATFPTNENVGKPKLSGFGDTVRLAAGFSFGACLVGPDWRFYLKSLSIPIKILLQPPNFKLGAREWKDIDSPASAVINSANIKPVIKALTPNTANEFKAYCSGVKYKQTVNNYPPRDGFWSRNITSGHEDFHKAEWSKAYKSELIKAEDKILNTVKLPAASAANAGMAVAAVAKMLTSIMIDAYVTATKNYCPNREIRAYNQDEPKYKALVKGIKARGRREKWL